MKTNKWTERQAAIRCAVVSAYAPKWTSLVVHMVKHLPTMWETWVQSLGWEDLLEKEMATHSNILAWKKKKNKKHGQRSLIGYSPWGPKSHTSLNNFTFTFMFLNSTRLVFKFSKKSDSIYSCGISQHNTSWIQIKSSLLKYLRFKKGKYDITNKRLILIIVITLK